MLSTDRACCEVDVRYVDPTPDPVESARRAWAGHLSDGHRPATHRCVPAFSRQYHTASPMASLAQGRFACSCRPFLFNVQIVVVCY